MPKIEIVEYDLTSPGRNAESNDIAYIPGFVDVKNNFTTQGYENVLAINVPTLFTDVASFEAKCGKKAPVFSTTQYYKDVGGMNTGFSEEAVPYNGIMFAEGDADPAYVMAKELLSMGLNVLYERVNPDVDNPKYKTFTPNTTAPENWEEIKNSCEKLSTLYKDVLTPTMPEFTTVANGTVYDNKVTYYTRHIGKVENIEKVYYVVATLKDGVHYDSTTKVIKSKTDLQTTYYTLNTEITYDLRSNVPSGTEFVANKYYQKSTAFANTYELISGEQPGNWPANAFVFTKQTFEDSNITVDSKQIAIKTFSDDWIEKWNTNGIFEDVQWESNSGAEFDPNATYRVAVESIDINTMYNALDSIFDVGSSDGLMDKGNYSFKYMTTGGYPVYEYNSGTLVQKMLAVAANRGDCVAFIDHTDNINRDNNIDHTDSLYATVLEDNTWKTDGEFGTMFTPWATYNRLTSDGDNTSTQIRMPASFAYLLALADSIKTNANWLAIAGAARGAVQHLADDGMTTIIPNGAADRMQPRNKVAVNPITNINPYGNIIWGNRTLKDNAEEGNLTATSFLNIRNLVSDIKKQCYRTARQLTFEQNNDILWTTFKAMMSPMLDTMLSGYGISGYKMVTDTDKLRDLGYPKATLCVKIIIFPTYPVEDFYISVVLKDDDVSVAEV